MMLIDKQNVEKKLRRSHFEGLFAEVALSKHHTAIQARINSIQVYPEELTAKRQCLACSVFQVDSQLPFAPNPTIFYPYPTPPAIASKFGKWHVGVLREGLYLVYVRSCLIGSSDVG